MKKNGMEFAICFIPETLVNNLKNLLEKTYEIASLEIFSINHHCPYF